MARSAFHLKAREAVFIILRDPLSTGRTLCSHYNYFDSGPNDFDLRSFFKVSQSLASMLLLPSFGLSFVRLVLKRLVCIVDLYR